MLGIPSRSRVRNVIMDRTPRAVDRELAHNLIVGLGYGMVVTCNLEAQSWGRTHENALGFTHTPENAQDHYWRLICIDKQWYFQFVDYSPPIDR